MSIQSLSDKLQNALSLSSSPEYVAQGGFKTVFKMINSNGTPEALKAIHIPKVRPDNHEDLLHREQLLARANREIVALNECKHSAIVKLGNIRPTDIACDDRDYLVYSEEFLPGEPLSNWLSPDRNPAPFQNLLHVMQTLVSLIANLSSLGYLHRDIKPDNIIHTGNKDRRFVVLDMGIAYKMQGPDLTQLAGGAPGTLRYMAPELLRPDYKDNMDFRSDLYSAALTVYVLATKNHPFMPKPESPHATVYRIWNDHPAPLHTLRSDLPTEFCQIISRCIRKKPALRYNNISTLISEMERLSV